MLGSREEEKGVGASPRGQKWRGGGRLRELYVTLEREEDKRRVEQRRMLL